MKKLLTRLSFALCPSVFMIAAIKHATAEMGAPPECTNPVRIPICRQQFPCVCVPGVY